MVIKKWMLAFGQVEWRVERKWKIYTLLILVELGYNFVIVLLDQTYVCNVKTADFWMLTTGFFSPNKSAEAYLMWEAQVSFSKQHFASSQMKSNEEIATHSV